MIGIPLGLLYSNAAEWWIHKNILHGLGKNRSSFWSFHWHEHHAEARRHEMVDEQLTALAAADPKLAVVEPTTNPLPVTVTTVPPLSGPAFGDTPLTAGAVS